jgi:hypothetical protein
MNRRFFGGQNASRDHATALLPHRGHRCCLMHVKRHILRRAFHEGRSLPGSTCLRRLRGTRKGRALNIR